MTGSVISTATDGAPSSCATLFGNMHTPSSDWIISSIKCHCDVFAITFGVKPAFFACGIYDFIQIEVFIEHDEVRIPKCIEADGAGLGERVVRMDDQAQCFRQEGEGIKVTFPG